jgi:hypothetical protein
MAAELSDAKKSAFEKCKAARAAALQRKREAKEAKAAPPPPEPEVHEPVDDPEPEPEPVSMPAPAPVRPPTPPPSPIAEEEEYDILDPNELIAMMRTQQEMITSLHDEVRGMKTHQADLANSFSTHGVKTQYALNFV